MKFKSEYLNALNEIRIGVLKYQTLSSRYQSRSIIIDNAKIDLERMEKEQVELKKEINALHGKLSYFEKITDKVKQ